MPMPSRTCTGQRPMQLKRSGNDGGCPRAWLRLWRRRSRPQHRFVRDSERGGAGSIDSDHVRRGKRDRDDRDRRSSRSTLHLVEVIVHRMGDVVGIRSRSPMVVIMVVTMMGRVARVLLVSATPVRTFTRMRVRVPGEVDRDEDLLEDEASRDDRCHDRVRLLGSVRMDHRQAPRWARPEPSVPREAEEGPQLDRSRRGRSETLSPSSAPARPAAPWRWSVRCSP